MQEVWIVSACRTAIGKFGGSLSNISVTDLGCAVISESIKRAKIEPSLIEETIMGHALQAGSGQGASRVAAIKAGIPETSSAFSINNVCGSSLRAINIAAALISAGENNIILAGGMESMSQSPFILSNIRCGNKIGNMVVKDVILHDGLTDAFEKYHMGITAESLSKLYGISRIQQDEYSVLSQNRAERAINSKLFAKEIIPININDNYLFDTDEQCRRNNKIEELQNLKPIFCDNGTVTAANSSGLGDGAAAIVLASSKAINQYQMRPIAKIICCASVGVNHQIMGMGSANAIKKILKKLKLEISDIDLFEINEAFAAQIIAVKNELNIDINKLNVSGGSIALGHPLGASGARIMVTLINNLLCKGGKYGIASICVGGGMGVSTLIEMV